MGAIDGLKVVDMTRFVSGTFCSMQLADHGADVIKIESPVDKGDELRTWGPFDGDKSYYFMSLNKNKRSIAVDLRSREGIEIVKRLIRKGDVLVENFRPGVMHKMGLSWEEVHKINPRIIYCSITAYGQTGPFKNKAGFDPSVQGDSGFMDITGFDTPTRVGIGLTDFIGAFYGLSGIFMALIARDKTGEGQRVDAAMLDGMLALLTYQAGTYFATGKTPVRTGNRHPQQTPYSTFPTKDGFVIIAAGTQKLWENLCTNVLRQPRLIEDPRFLTVKDRNRNYAFLENIIEEVTRTKETDEWLEMLERAGIPCGKVRTVKEALDLDHTKAREMVVEFDDALRGKIKLLGIPTKMSLTPGAIRRMPPFLGEHTEEIMKELEYDEAEVQAMENKNVIRQYRVK
ncbi:MAG: CoA transferase [Deltaproteobacteria bacterium]|nr:CoA transferase [Deltaproteobacteria bacterium]